MNQKMRIQEKISVKTNLQGVSTKKKFFLAEISFHKALLIFHASSIRLITYKEDQAKMMKDKSMIGQERGRSYPINTLFFLIIILGLRLR